MLQRPRETGEGCESTCVCTHTGLSVRDGCHVGPVNVCGCAGVCACVVSECGTSFVCLWLPLPGCGESRSFPIVSEGRAEQPCPTRSQGVSGGVEGGCWAQLLQAGVLLGGAGSSRSRPPSSVMAPRGRSGVPRGLPRGSFCTTGRGILSSDVIVSLGWPCTHWPLLQGRLGYTQPAGSPSSHGQSPRLYPCPLCLSTRLLGSWGR